ncbi:MAG: DinB family protein [Acidobacteriota bacterium]|nr:DinB family protein [Acidobacteriota bacterium]
MIIPRPAENEFAPFYASYVAKVGDRGPLAFLNAQVTEFERIRGLADAKGDHRYAEGKWSVKELLGHLADAERVFAYRLLRIARADQTPLAGFDENAWAEVAPHGRRTLVEVVDDLIAVRRATITLVESLDATALGNVGVANNNPVSARAICWIIAGHAQHHLGILQDRYSVGI